MQIGCRREIARDRRPPSSLVVATDGGGREVNSRNGSRRQGPPRVSRFARGLADEGSLSAEIAHAARRREEEAGNERALSNLSAELWRRRESQMVLGLLRETRATPLLHSSRRACPGWISDRDDHDGSLVKRLKRPRSCGESDERPEESIGRRPASVTRSHG